MRTDSEILARIDTLQVEDVFGFESTDLIGSLSFDAARKFLIEDVKREEWQQRNDAQIRAIIVEYLPFAIEKATNHRGLSASRSISHMRAWCWLLGDDESVAMIDSPKYYRPYGMPILKHLCAKYGVNFPTDPEADRMGRGEACVIGCREGCNL